MSVHTVHENDPWTENVGDHPGRKDSPTYIAARKCMIQAVQQVQPWIYGDKPYQDHHGGGVWVKDADGWLLVKNVVGLEWSAQFCLDAPKLDKVRVNAERIVRAFPLTEDAYKADLGMSDQHLAILHHHISTADDIAAYVDSFWNASVPLPAGKHTGVLSPGKQEAGVHHYPTPITDIEFIKRDDFVLFVVDPATGATVAVAPTAAYGSGDATVKLLYHPNDPQAEGTVLAADHPMALAAFRHQEKST